MAISSVGSYTNSYENLYTYNQTKKSETSEISEVKTETTKKSNNEEYLKSLQKQVPYMKLQIGYGLNTSNDGKVNVVDVNPKLVEKMQNDPKAAKEYTQRLKDVESALKWLDNYKKSVGSTVIVRHDYIDENGKTNDLREIDWTNCVKNPHIYTIQDWEKLNESKKFFARKFDINKDPDVIFKIYNQLKID